MPDGDDLRRGDYVNGVEDLFRFLRRGREYLVEADRQLRGGGTEGEQAESVAWYAEMDASDEWTGLNAEAHAACVHDIILFFEEHAEFVAQYDGKIHLLTQYDKDGRFIAAQFRKLKVAVELEQLRKDVLEIESRIAAQSAKQ